MKPFSLIKNLSVAMVLLMLSSLAVAFTDLEGKEDSIQNYLGKGKWTIIEIWKSDCHSCRQHMPSMVEFDRKLDNVRILGITLDGQAGISDANNFLADFDIKFPNLVSNPTEVNAWLEENIEESLRGTPTFILFNDKGELIAAQAGIVPIESLEKFIISNSTSTTD